ncbi:MAG: hypothetical protein J6M31_06940 [Bacteroidales bacterium]|nr:hypothetical protein [Bacteroidales bacterium]
MRKRLTLSIFLLLLCLLPLQGRRIPREPFIRTDLNVLQKPAGSAPYYDLFLRKLDSLLLTGGTDVHILHIGGSHVQGGTLSDRLRRHFLSLRYGIDGGRGLVFPYAVAMTNTPVSYNSSYAGAWESANCLKPGDAELGLSGMLAVAQDTSARMVIDLTPRESGMLQQRYSFKSVDLLGSGELTPLLVQGKDTLRGVKGTHLVHFDLPYFTDWLCLAFEGSGKFSLRGVYLDRPGGGLSLSEAGVNGASTLSWNHCTRWEEDLKRVMPDLVIFSIGINDIQAADFDASRFKRHYRSLMKEIRKANPRCAFLFTGINDSVLRRKGVNPHTQAVEDACKDLARECSGVFWDWYAVMGGYGSMDQWVTAGLAQSDHIHFTPGGYKLVADLLFDAILEDYYTRR